MINVLMTSAGRRVSLLKAFKRAVEKRAGTVLAADADPLAPALFLAHRGIQMEPLGREGYLDGLLKLVERERIGLVVPTIDTELELLSRNAGKFQDLGCLALVSGLELINICNDKWNTVEFFSSHGVDVPLSWLPQHIEGQDLPETVFVKPRGGSASRNARRVAREDLPKAVELTDEPLIVQECLEGDEITVDCLLGLNGEVIHYVPRIRIKAVGGESVEGVTISDEPIRDWMLKVLSLISQAGGMGPITVQAFLTERGPVLSEVNPRFGGGFPLALAAGGDYPEWIVRMVQGEDVSPRIGEYRVGLKMTRFYQEIFVWEDGGVELP